MEKTSSGRGKLLVPILLAAVIVLLLIVVIVLLVRPAGTAQNGGDPAQSAGVPKLAYANEGVTVVDDPDALQKAVDEMYQQVEEGRIALNYQNDAASEDGTNFSCYLGNSPDNRYDAYFVIFADDQLTDQLCLTGLIKPGQAFESLTLTRALDKGVHRLYVAMTQVEEDMQTLHANVVFTMDFTVS